MCGGGGGAVPAWPATGHMVKKAERGCLNALSLGTRPRLETSPSLLPRTHTGWEEPLGGVPKEGCSGSNIPSLEGCGYSP